jgi:hypothetical protein
MDYQLQCKLCFVTAGANGVGAAIANFLRAEGARDIAADNLVGHVLMVDGGWTIQ